MKITDIIRNTASLFHRRSFNQFFKEYLDSYTKKDKRVIKQAYTKYMLFMDSLPDKTRPAAPNSSTVRAFVDFLNQTSRGGGAASTYSRFRKVAAQAVREGVLKENPCTGTKCHGSGNELVKDILSEYEIRLMLKTCDKGGNTAIRKAFVFCLYTGLRFVDVTGLTYSNIDMHNRLLSIRQSKTQGLVHIPLRDDIMQLTMGDMHTRRPEQKVFPLPSHTTCMKELRKWTEETGIIKHITWHCARHTFASSILMNGADIRIVASLLGHSGLRHVEKYTRAVDQKRYQAVDTLPKLS